MKTSNEGLAEITGYEGVCTAPYLDSGGVWTFGIGHTRFDGIDPIPEHMEKGRDHSIEFCFELFKKTIVKYEDSVNKALKVPVSQAKFDALVSFHYNTGEIARSTLIKRINAGASPESIKAAFMMWVKDNGLTVKGLVNRRKNEAKLYNTGLYTQHGMALVSTANIYGKEYGAKSMNILEYIE